MVAPVTPKFKLFNLLDALSPVSTGRCVSLLASAYHSGEILVDYMTPLSAEARIASRLRDLGASVIFLSVLADMPPTRLSFGLRGLKPLSNSDAEKLLNLTQRLVELRDAMLPIPIALTQPAVVEAFLERLDQKGLGPEEIRALVQKIFE